MFLCTQAVGKMMVRQKKGVIINIASIAGVVGPHHEIYRGIKSPYSGKPFNTPVAYSTTKAGVINFTRYLATYWAKKNIRVNALSPGGVYEGHQSAFVKNYSALVPMGRMAQKDEYKGAILFLASDASSYMTGANLIVDGGLTSW
jgi:NAD(P)-dependent dehydrogenase (short-subunit alcohol dehydrogenase family)